MIRSCCIPINICNATIKIIANNRKQFITGILWDPSTKSLGKKCDKSDKGEYYVYIYCKKYKIHPKSNCKNKQQK